MKILRTVLIILGLIIVAFLVVSLFAPSEFSAKRSVLIDAPRSTVFSSVNNLEKWEHWEPWRSADTAAIIEYSDTIAGAGAWYKWEGEEIGKGKLTIEESQPYEHIKLHLNFYDQGTAESTFTFSDSSDMTRAAWDFYTEEGFPGNVFMWLAGVEGMIAESYQKGLDTLKAHVERITGKKYRGYEIDHTTFPGHVYVGTRETVKIEQMSDFFRSALTHTSIQINKNNLKMAGSPAGLYFTWDEENKQSDMMAAIPVQSKPQNLSDTTLTVYEVPESKALKIEYFGAYEDSGEAHYAIEDYAKATGLQMKEPVIEEYVTDPSMENDTSKWQTDIYYLLKAGQ